MELGRFLCASIRCLLINGEVENGAWEKFSGGGGKEC